MTKWLQRSTARGRDRPARRLGARVAAVLMLSGAFVVVSAGPASAATVPCPGGVTWTQIMQYRNLKRWEATRITLQSSAPVFLVSDSRFLDNALDVPAEYTVTSSVSKTFTISASTGIEIDVEEWLTHNVSTSIEASWTTSIGVSVTTQVAPHTRVVAEYGIQAFNVSYLIERWWGDTYRGETPAPGGKCQDKGYYPQQTIGPTNVEGWRLRLG